MLLRRGVIRSYWWNQVRNLGDAYAPLIVSKLFSGRVVRSAAWERRKLVSCGSVIAQARDGDVVWGTGSLLPDTTMRAKNLAVTAVRGPLTRNVLLRHGIDCPEVYGDPGCMAPLVYPKCPTDGVRRRPGIILHYVDKAEIVIDDPGVVVLDIQSEPEEFFRRLAGCDRVVSSSLHGIIFAEAYGIPAAWMQISDKVVGGRHKFEDYYLGTGRECPFPLRAAHMFADPKWIPPVVDNVSSLRTAFVAALARMSA